MSANGHESDSFAHSSEHHSGGVSAVVLNIGRYSVLPESFDVNNLHLKPVPPAKDELPGYTLPSEFIIDPNRPMIEYKPPSLADIFASRPYAPVTGIEKETPETDVDQSESLESPAPQPEAVRFVINPNRTVPGPISSWKEHIETPEILATPKLKSFQKIGILAIAASTKIKTLELGKMAREYKESWAVTADEVTMDIAKRIDNISLPGSISDIGRRTSLMFANTISSASSKLEKHANKRNAIGLAAAAVAIAGTYSIYKFGVNPFSGSSNMAEKTNHANDLLSIAKPTKTPQAEHMQLAHAALGPKTNTEHVARASEVISHQTTVAHTETINSASDTIWNSVDKQLQGELGHKPTSQQVIDGCNKVFKLNKHIGGWEGAKHLHTGFSYRIPNKLV